MRSLLYGVNAIDSVTFTAVPALLACIALLRATSRRGEPRASIDSIAKVEVKALPEHQKLAS